MLYKDGLSLPRWFDLGVDDSLTRCMTNGQQVGAGSLARAVHQGLWFLSMWISPQTQGFLITWWLSYNMVAEPISPKNMLEMHIFDLVLVVTYSFIYAVHCSLKLPQRLA